MLTPTAANKFKKRKQSSNQSKSPDQTNAKLKTIEVSDS